MNALIGFLHALPNWATFLTARVVLTGRFIFMAQPRRRLVGVDPDKATTDAAMDGVKALTTFLVFILACR